MIDEYLLKGADESFQKKSTVSLPPGEPQTGAQPRIFFSKYHYYDRCYNFESKKASNLPYY